MVYLWVQENNESILPPAAFIELADAAGCLVSKGSSALSSVHFGSSTLPIQPHALAVICDLKIGAIQISDDETSVTRLTCFLARQHDKVILHCSCNSHIQIEVC